MAGMARMAELAGFWVTGCLFSWVGWMAGGLGWLGRLSSWCWWLGIGLFQWKFSNSVLYKLIQGAVVWRDAELVCQADEHQEGLQLPGGLGG